MNVSLLKDINIIYQLFVFVSIGLVCLPLLFYMSLSMEIKDSFSKRDILTILLAFSTVFFGFLMIIVPFMIANIIFLIVSFLCGITALFLIQNVPGDVRVDDLILFTSNREKEMELLQKRKQLNMFLLFTVPIFPIVYILSLTDILDRNQTFVAFTSCSILSKVIFVTIMINSHVDIVMSKYADRTKKEFLRYMMHEMRVPLSSVSTGLGVLESNSGLSGDMRSILSIMTNATSSMRETLDDMLLMQQLGEGTFELHMGPFYLRELVDAVKNIRIEKHVPIHVDIAANVPHCVIGDKCRLTTVLLKVVNYAIMRSPFGSMVNLKVSAKEDTCLLLETKKKNTFVIFTITDNGPPISSQNMELLYQPFLELKPHEIGKYEEDSPGPDLSLCRQITKLHGGTFNCVSSEDSGCTFTMTIPFVSSSAGLHEMHISEKVIFRNSPLSKQLNLQDEVYLHSSRKSSSAHSSLYDTPRRLPQGAVHDGK